MIEDAINNPHNYGVLYAVEDFILFKKDNKQSYVMSQEELNMFLKAQIDNGLKPSTTNEN
jgi:hypothetical protein